MANVLVFSGLAFLSAEAGSSGADRVAVFLVHALVDEKFYSLFSLLFGAGFALQMRRAGDRGAAFEALFARRMGLLLSIGLAHAILVWPGDILILYALLGFVLLAFRGASDRALLVGGAALLASPVAVYALYLAIGVGDPFAAGPEGPGGILTAILDGYRTGGYADVVASNALLLPAAWLRYALVVRVPKVLGMFLLGAWIVRRGFLDEPGENRPVLARAARWGLAIGLPANLLVAALAERHAHLPASPEGLLQTSLAAVGVPALAFGYAASTVLLANRTRVPAAFAPAGRLALTNYLGQSVACVAIFYGLGLGLFGRIAPIGAFAIAIAVFSVQVAASRLWLERFATGPAEWAWRRATYGAPVRFRARGRPEARSATGPRSEPARRGFVDGARVGAQPPAGGRPRGEGVGSTQSRSISR